MVKIYADVAQGTPEWRKLRMGIPTASGADKLITPTGKLSSQWRGYAYELVTERLLHEVSETLDGISYIERGRDLEADAVQQYELVNDVRTARVGIILTDDGRWGASPDRLILGPRDDLASIPPKAGLEIKCPKAKTHVGYLIDSDAPAYKPQVQFQIMVCEFSYVDFCSYHPMCPPFQKRIFPDLEFIKALRDATERLSDTVDEWAEKALTLGTFQPFDEMAIPTGYGQDAVQGRAAWEYLRAG